MTPSFLSLGAGVGGDVLLSNAAAALLPLCRADCVDGCLLHPNPFAAAHPPLSHLQCWVRTSWTAGAPQRRKKREEKEEKDFFGV